MLVYIKRRTFFSHFAPLITFSLKSTSIKSLIDLSRILFEDNSELNLRDSMIFPTMIEGNNGGPLRHKLLPVDFDEICFRDRDSLVERHNMWFFRCKKCILLLSKNDESQKTTHFDHLLLIMIK